MRMRFLSNGRLGAQWRATKFAILRSLPVLRGISSVIVLCREVVHTVGHTHVTFDRLNQCIMPPWTNAVLDQIYCDGRIYVIYCCFEP